MIAEAPALLRHYTLHLVQLTSQHFTILMEVRVWRKALLEVAEFNVIQPLHPLHVTLKPFASIITCELEAHCIYNM